MKKYLLATVVLCALLVLAFAAQSHALLLDPADETYCLSGNETSQALVSAAIAGTIGASEELYKNDVGDPDEGLLAGSYETVFSNTETDPADATITYIGGDFVDDPAFLLVKDGNQDPAWYLYCLTADFGWDGMETIELENFWPNGGAISHVTLYGGSSQVPEPATMLLLGTGLIGLGFFGRKKFFKKS